MVIIPADGKIDIHRGDKKLTTEYCSDGRISICGETE